MGALSLAPYVLPLVGLGTSSAAGHMMHQISGSAAEGALGSGLAGTMQGALAGIPFLGEAITSTSLITVPGLGISLASGALLTLGLTAGIGIGGMLLANWLEKREDPNARIPWSKVVRYTALTTSILIALPGLLGAISVGIAFLATLVHPSLGFDAVATMHQTLGAPTMEMAGAASGFAALLPHLLTCGLPFLPLATAFFLGKPAADKAITGAHVELVSAPRLKPGEPAILSFRVMDGQGRPLSPAQLETTYTQKLHTMVVDRSLRDYHHLHPVYDPQSGLFTCSVTPQLAGDYMAWHDFTPRGATASVTQRIDLPSQAGYALPPRILPQSQSSAGGLHVSIRSDAPLEAGKPGMLEIRVTDAQGQPVNQLDPIMGAYGHLAGFSADGQHFIHSHPMTPLSEPLQEGRLRFHIAPDTAGMTQFFLQLRHQGQEIILPFGQAVRAPERFATRAEATPHHQHAMA